MTAFVDFNLKNSFLKFSSRLSVSLIKTERRDKNPAFLQKLYNDSTFMILSLLIFEWSLNNNLNSSIIKTAFR